MMLRGLTLWRLAAMVSLAIPTTAVFVWNHSWWPLILFVGWTIGIGAALLVIEKRKHLEHCERLLNHSQLSAIRTLSHHRHDWMNELQILYGYLRLNKLDKAVDVVDRIRVRMEHDSKLSQIGIPELSTFLLSFRSVCDTMRLEVEIQEGLYLDRLPYPAEKLSRAVIGLVNIIRYRAVIPIAGENILRLFMYQSDFEFKLKMTYEGELAAADSIRLELEQCINELGRLDTEDELAEKTQISRTMVVHFPLPA